MGLPPSSLVFLRVLFSFIHFFTILLSSFLCLLTFTSVPSIHFFSYSISFSLSSYVHFCSFYSFHFISYSLLISFFISFHLFYFLFFVFLRSLLLHFISSPSLFYSIYKLSSPLLSFMQRPNNVPYGRKRSCLELIYTEFQYK